MRMPISFRLRLFPLQSGNDDTSSFRHQSSRLIATVIWRHPRIFFRFSQTKYQLQKTAGCATSESACVLSREIQTVQVIPACRVGGRAIRALRCMGARSGRTIASSSLEEFRQ
ncbi:hypothetical protein Bxe_C0413 [Paraburkholderia xenovorans LB400]|uniref:Uncharacterized protein n=1 Tax=Paraburkholderia xenovorans (strain LB400) TaxID=266265 RepID=Q13HX2_PARXL|nr:hypothetical protein Bxe_C0413 [Paraburkholderia xenovorans LB400]